MKTFFKITLILLLFFMITINYNISNAADGAGMLGDMQSNIESFLTHGKTQASNIDYGNVTSPFASLAQILVTIGAGVMVAVTTYMGIKYLTSGPEAQAKLKIQLIGLVVAGVVIFGSYNIWKIVVLFASKL